MLVMSLNDLPQGLAEHAKWLADPATGSRLVVSRGAYLSDADLGGAVLRYAYLSGAYLRGAYLRDADLRDADLSDADLRGTDLRYAHLRGTDLRDADLRGAYLRGAKGLPPAPIVPDIDAAILAALEAGGILNMEQWHDCGTTHCRAGWAIHLAGDEGYALERKYGSPLAGALIYQASRPGMPIPDFYSTNEDALADIRKHAKGIG